ncbi:DUF6412 domain-containing protein [Paractinoplanes rishiriensis]|uniref:Uncharacterized protein n=1 Tax=Paractinoplanes rishiriensis TaxID=1050105 RepID=A0A919MVT9_9ACTN|nr:DUF6412 domain-containing protein [Actinoplanes rishiriensis]GIE93965.1 hypothetical protein Ari01nite_14300 [Actinoplanes rishiriensis]
MVLWGFWVLAALLDPAQQSPATLALGLTVLAAGLLVAAVVALPVPIPAAAPGVRAFARRSRTAAPSRLRDPDAAGRPRPRAPGLYPAAA